MSWLKENYIKILCLAAGIVVMLWAQSCAPTVTSLIDPNRKVNAQELQIEFDTLVQMFEVRQLDLDRQNKLQELLARNAMLMAETGTFNPVGFLTGLFALYGLGSATNGTVNVIKRKRVAVSYNTDTSEVNPPG